MCMCIYILLNYQTIIVIYSVIFTIELRASSLYYLSLYFPFSLHTRVYMYLHQIQTFISTTNCPKTGDWFCNCCFIFYLQLIDTVIELLIIGWRIQTRSLVDALLQFTAIFLRQPTIPTLRLKPIALPENSLMVIIWFCSMYSKYQMNNSTFSFSPYLL